MSSVSKLAKTVLRKMGLDVRLVRNVEAYERRTWEEKWADDWRFLENHDIRTIIDIGANTGQFAAMIHRVCPASRILSFEPIADCFEGLQHTLAGIPGSRAFKLALGDTNGPCVMNRSEFTPCSSMLPLTGLVCKDHPDAAKITRENVQVAGLDDVLNGEELAPELLVKIDVQGYEDKVMRGGPLTLAKASFVAMEVTFDDEYEGQPSFDVLYRMMADLGFAYRGAAGQYTSKVDHRFMYADAIFENTTLAKERA